MIVTNTAELVHRAALGEEPAWRQLFDIYDPILGRVARTYRLDEAQVADAVSVAWMRFIEHASSLRDAGGAGGWLITTVRRECLRLLRQRHRELPVAELDPGRQDHRGDPPPDQRLIDDARNAVLARAVTQLTEHQHRLLQLLISDPTPSYQEISSRLAIPIGSIGPTRMRIMCKLRRLLADDPEWQRV